MFSPIPNSSNADLPVSLAAMSPAQLHNVLHCTLVALEDALDQAASARRAVRDGLIALDEELHAAVRFKTKAAAIIARLRKPQNGTDH